MPIPTEPQSSESYSLSTEERRCLAALADEGGFGQSALRDGFVALARRTKGITLAVSLIRAHTADRLVERGLAEWIARGNAARLHITPEGRAAFSNNGQLGLRKDNASARHQELELRSIEEPEGRRDVVVNRRESPLLWLARRKGADGQPLIAASAFAAGERLRMDFESAGLSPRMNIDWARFGMGTTARSGSEGNASEAMISARMRMRKAVAALGDQFAGPVIDICCFLKGLEHVERERGWKQRTARHVLAQGLARLAKHYGLSDEGRGPDQSRQIRIAIMS